MGHKKEKHEHKVRKERIAARENKAYYQRGSEWKHPSSEQAIRDRRKDA